MALQVPPPTKLEENLLHGFMRGSAVIPGEIDLTEPICQDELDVESGKLFEA